MQNFIVKMGAFLEMLFGAVFMASFFYYPMFFFFFFLGGVLIGDGYDTLKRKKK